VNGLSSLSQSQNRKNLKWSIVQPIISPIVVSIAIRGATRGDTGGRSSGCALRGPPTLRYNGQLMAGGPADPR